MRILVTGGVGIVGSGLVSELRKRNCHVVSCDVSHQPDEVGFTVGTDLKTPLYARCNIGEFRQIERVFEKMGPFDYVYNCAAEFGRWNGEDFYETLWQTNCVGTKNIIRLQERLGFRLIHFSSSEVYGDWPDLMVESVMDDHEIKQMNDYAMTKWVNEMQVKIQRSSTTRKVWWCGFSTPMVQENITVRTGPLIAGFCIALFTICPGRYFGITRARRPI